VIDNKHCKFEAINKEHLWFVCSMCVWRRRLALGHQHLECLLVWSWSLLPEAGPYNHNCAWLTHW